jgi:hypothetical protein
MDGPDAGEPPASFPVAAASAAASHDGRSMCMTTADREGNSVAAGGGGSHSSGAASYQCRGRGVCRAAVMEFVEALGDESSMGGPASLPAEDGVGGDVGFAGCLAAGGCGAGAAGEEDEDEQDCLLPTSPRAAALAEIAGGAMVVLERRMHAEGAAGRGCDTAGPTSAANNTVGGLRLAGATSADAATLAGAAAAAALLLPRNSSLDDLLSHSMVTAF